MTRGEVVEQWMRAVEFTVEIDDDDELMECPSCKEIELPVDGGECGYCHMPCCF